MIRGPTFSVCATVTLSLALSFALAARADDAQLDKNSKVPEHQNHPVDSNPPAAKGTWVDLQVGGETSHAYLARPAGAIRGGILVVHEFWGLNAWVQHEADKLADEGYLALAIDLYKGKVATTHEDAAAMMKALDESWSAQVEQAGISWLKANARGKKLATIGWCMGGGESLHATLTDPADISATVIYYGMPVTDPAKIATLKNDAVLGLYAKKDGWITPDKVDAFDKALTAAGVVHEVHEYDADHAFANPTGGRHNPAAAKDAWAKTTAFLAAQLN